MIKKIIVFGDSIAFGSNDWTFGGWVVRLKNYFAKTGQFHHVFNLGISGENSDQIIRRMESETLSRKSENPEKKLLLIIGIPINDIRVTGALDADPELSVRRFRKNLKNFYDIGIRNANELVFIGMTKVDEEKTDPWQEVIERRIACWRNDIIREYNEIVKKYCKDENINFIEMIDVLEDSDLPDGLHPNEIGHEKMYKRIKDFLVNNGLVKKL